VVQSTAPTYAKNSDELTTAMRNFDMTYNAYNEFQNRMERYWCLQYLLQEGIQEVQATVWRENLVRFDDMPYITKVHSLPELAVGTRVTLEIKRIDTLMMEVDTRFKANAVKASDATAIDVGASEANTSEVSADPSAEVAV